MKGNDFEFLLQRFEPLIKKLLLHLNIYKNHDEFYQIGRIALWEAMKRFDETKGHFPAFAAVTIKGKMLEHLRKENRYEEHNMLTQKSTDHDNTNNITEAPLDRELFECYLAPLSEKQKTWAIESIVHQKTPSEIAKEYGTTSEAVKSWRKEALKILRNRAKIM